MWVIICQEVVRILALCVEEKTDASESREDIVSLGELWNIDHLADQD